MLIWKIVLPSIVLSKHTPDLASGLVLAANDQFVDFLAVFELLYAFKDGAFLKLQLGAQRLIGDGDDQGALFNADRITAPCEIAEDLVPVFNQAPLGAGFLELVFLLEDDQQVVERHGIYARRLRDCSREAAKVSDDIFDVFGELHLLISEHLSGKM